jgi:hypothetical protein
MIQDELSFKLLLRFLEFAAGSCVASFIIGNPRIINFIMGIKMEVNRWESMQPKRNVYAILAIMVIAGIAGNAILANYYYHQLPPEVWQRIFQL